MRAWSFSSLNQYYTCPRQYDLQRNKQVIKFSESVETLWGKEVHRAMEESMQEGLPMVERFAAFQPYVDKIKALSGERFVEWEFALTKSLTPTGFKDENAWCRGIIDVGVVDGDRALVCDWKTGKVRPDSDQLKLFAAATMAHYPNVQTVKTAYVWLAHGCTTPETYTRADLPKIWEHFIIKVKHLERAYQHDKWTPKPSGLCRGWCGAGLSNCEFWEPKR